VKKNNFNLLFCSLLQLCYWKSSEGRRMSKEVDILITQADHFRPDVRASIDGLPANVLMRAQVSVMNRHRTGPGSQIIDFKTPEGGRLMLVWHVNYVHVCHLNLYVCEIHVTTDHVKKRGLNFKYQKTTSGIKMYEGFSAITTWTTQIHYFPQMWQVKTEAYWAPILFISQVIMGCLGFFCWLYISGIHYLYIVYLHIICCLEI